MSSGCESVTTPTRSPHFLDNHPKTRSSSREDFARIHAVVSKALLNSGFTDAARNYPTASLTLPTELVLALAGHSLEYGKGVSFSASILPGIASALEQKGSLFEKEILVQATFCISMLEKRGIILDSNSSDTLLYKAAFHLALENEIDCMRVITSYIQSDDAWTILKKEETIYNRITEMLKSCPPRVNPFLINLRNRLGDLFNGIVDELLLLEPE